MRGSLEIVGSSYDLRLGKLRARKVFGKDTQIDFSIELFKHKFRFTRSGYVYRMTLKALTS